jgi:nucleoside-diphosphate-sugar epimerase
LRKRLSKSAHGIYRAAETPAASGQVDNLTDGALVTRRQFVGTLARLAGLPESRRKIPRRLARGLASGLGRRARRRGATEPPLINMAHYKFLGLNLDYSIAKAQRELGYQPPYTTEQGLERSMAALLAAETQPR